MAISDVFDRVYKFREFSKQNIAALENQYLWFSEPTLFEDDSEGSYTFDDKITDTELVNFGKKALIEDGYPARIAEALILRKVLNGDYFTFIRQKINTLHIDFSTYSNSMNHLSTVGRLATRPDVNMAANDFMWKNYGGALTGFCIEFCSERLLTSLKERNPKSKIMFGKVNYTDEIPNRNLSEDIDDLLIKYVKHYFRKQNNYIDEFECRFSSCLSGKHFYRSECVENIYFGSEMSTLDRKKLEDIISRKYPNASVFILFRGKNSYQSFKKRKID